MDEVFRIGHRVTVLRDGRHVATRDIADVTPRSSSGSWPIAKWPNTIHAGSTRRGEELLRVDRLHGGGLEDISFVLHRGEILGIAGLVGAGRSRLARALVGADPVAERRIVVRGKADRHRFTAGCGACRDWVPAGGSEAAGVWCLRLSVERNMSLVAPRRACAVRRAQPA